MHNNIQNIPYLNLRRIRVEVFLLFITLLLSSCGMEFGTIDDDKLIAGEIKMDRTMAYIFVGDTLVLHPTITPEDVNNNEIYWVTSDAEVLSFSDNKFVGESEGNVTVVGMSVRHLISDTCTVTVMKPWEMDPMVFPSDMVVYANVTFHGKPLEEGMLVAAFCENELRGVGIQRMFHGISYTELRVRSEFLSSSDPETPWLSETISFRLYDPKNLMLYEFPQTIDFDIETHGTLSNLYQLSIP